MNSAQVRVHMEVVCMMHDAKISKHNLLRIGSGFNILN